MVTKNIMDFLFVVFVMNKLVVNELVLNFKVPKNEKVF